MFIEKTKMSEISIPDELLTNRDEARTSKSRIAVCENCRQEIGVFDSETINLPIRPSHFEKLPGDSQLQIMTGMPWWSFKDFRCQRCGERPWQENDRILTNSGYFVVKKRLNEMSDNEYFDWVRNTA